MEGRGFHSWYRREVFLNIRKYDSQMVSLNTTFSFKINNYYCLADAGVCSVAGCGVPGARREDLPPGGPR